MCEEGGFEIHEYVIDRLITIAIGNNTYRKSEKQVGQLNYATSAKIWKHGMKNGTKQTLLNKMINCTLFEEEKSQ